PVVAAAPTGIEASRALYVEAHLAAFTVWSVERMVAHLRRGDLGSIVAAAALVGLATSSKYPGALLLVPLVWSAAFPSGRLSSRPRFSRAVLACAVAAGAFAITSPFVFLDWTAARNDLRFAADLARAGH